MAKHEIFNVLCDLFYKGVAEVGKDVANRVVELAIEIFPDFRMSYEEKAETYSIKVENLEEVK